MKTQDIKRIAKDFDAKVAAEHVTSITYTLPNEDAGKFCKRLMMLGVDHQEIIATPDPFGIVEGMTRVTVSIR